MYIYNHISISGFVQIDFELGEPFAPYNQLMGVLPAASQHALPSPLRHLFDSEDSSILDFYPTDFQVDMNGKRFAWQGVALLPFIDEQRLLDATGPIIASLLNEDRRRNERYAFVGPWFCSGFNKMMDVIW
jgi:5'-3' exoribonuclease 2